MFTMVMVIFVFCYWLAYLRAFCSTSSMIFELFYQYFRCYCKADSFKYFFVVDSRLHLQAQDRCRREVPSIAVSTHLRTIVVIVMIIENAYHSGLLSFALWELKDFALNSGYKIAMIFYSWLILTGLFQASIQITFVLRNLKKNVPSIDIRLKLSNK